MNKVNCMILLMALTHVVHAAPQKDFLCEDTPLAIYPDIYFTCEGLQSFKKGFDTHALELFKRASLWGSKEAQYRVGLFYLGGIGTEADPMEGAAWLLLANERNNRQVTERLLTVMAVLSPFQQGEVSQRAAVLREQYGDFQALDRRDNWVRMQKRKTTGSRLGKPMATVRYLGSQGVTADQANQSLELYVTTLQDIVTNVNYRDFDVLEDDQDNDSEDDS